MPLPEILPITGIPTGKIPSNVIVCGDPERSDTIAQHFHESRLLSHRREFRTYIGSYKEMPVAVCSHGIGAPGASIAFEELIAAGAKNLVRCGTCGALQPDIYSGHIVIATGAVSNIGYAAVTVPAGYPALADYTLTASLNFAATESGRSFSTGIVLSTDGFYSGVNPAGSPEYQMMSAANVIAVEMECAALFIVGALRGVKTGAILAVDGNVLEGSGEQMESYNPRVNVVREAVEAQTDIALEALFRAYRTDHHAAG